MKRFVLPIFITLCHIPIFLLRFPEKKILKKQQKKIAINTIHLIQEPQTPTQNPIAHIGAPKKALVTKKKAAPKQKKIQRKKQNKKKLQKALNKTLAAKKFSQKRKKIPKKSLQKGKKFTANQKKNIKKDAGKEQREYNQYLQAVVQTLKDSLTLPEAGKVKLAITVSETGNIIKIVSLLSESDCNLSYLKEHLPKIVLPKYAKKENRTFTIVFCDEK